VSELFDGEPPHAPRGCIAQAWSVAEMFRAAAVSGAVAVSLR
jgi:glycogen debranching enzyme